MIDTVLSGAYEESLERFLFSQFNDYNQTFLGRVHKGFGEIQETLESMF